ncbi:MAG: tetratricopeptide repeat protein [Candidatus Caldarchaeum sp.]
MFDLNHSWLKLTKAALVSWILISAVIGSSVMIWMTDDLLRDPSKAFSGVPGNTEPLAEPNTPDCLHHTSHVYQTALRLLNSGRVSSLETLRASIEASLEEMPRQPEDLVLVPLESGLHPTVLVKFHCFLSVAEAYSSFQIFKYTSGRYKIAAASEQQSIVSQVGQYGLPVSHSILEITLLESPSPRYQYILTEWIPSGNKPGPHSFIIWEWNGNSLRPIWHRFDLILGHFTIVGRVMVLSWRVPDKEVLEDGTLKEAVFENEVYRLGERRLLFDGLLSQSLIEQYLRDQVIVPQGAESLRKIADLMYRSGAFNKAISFYERPLKMDSSSRLWYLYLVVADLYEKQGQYHEALQVLNRYRNLAQQELGSEGHREIEQRIQRLQQKIHQQ